MERKQVDLKQFKNVFLWEAKKRYYSLRYPFSICLGLLFFIVILPPNACRYLDVHTNLLVNIINYILAFTTIFGLCFLPYYYMSEPYGNEEYNKERTSSISTSLRLFTRVLVNVIQNGLVLLYGYKSMWGMMKFADEHHGYMTLEFSGGYGYTLLIGGLLSPMVYLTFVLRHYSTTQKKLTFLSYVLSTILQIIVFQVVFSALHNFPKRPQLLLHLLCIVGILLLSYLFFLRSCHYEKQI